MSDGVIDLRNQKDGDEPEFRIDHIDHDEEEREAFVRPPVEDAASHPHDKVKVKFDKFVNLIATHAYEDVFEKHMDEDVIISTNLLTDLANAHEQKEDKKMPMMFLFGIFLGIILAWIIFKT